MTDREQNRTYRCLNCDTPITADNERRPTPSIDPNLPLGWHQLQRYCEECYETLLRESPNAGLDRESSSHLDRCTFHENIYD